MASLGPNSRYRLSFVVSDEVRGIRYNLLRRERVSFDSNAENRLYQAQSGENSFAVAAKHFRRYARPASLFWLVCEYQPTPILDPTTDLGGRTIYIPPDSKVTEILQRDASSR